MTVPIVSPPMARKAATLAELLPMLSRGTSKVTGQRFYIVPASNRLAAHWTAVDGSGCTCVGYQRRGICTHAVAALAVHDTERRLAEPRGSVVCERQQAAEAVFATKTNVTPTPWRPCNRGCGELLSPTHLGKSCDPCWAKLAASLDFLEG